MISVFETLLEKKLRVHDYGRLTGSIIYAGTALVSLTIMFSWPPARQFIFYEEARQTFNNYPRLLWCIPWSFLGYAAIAFQASQHSNLEDRAWESYYSRILLTLLGVSSIVFVICHIFAETRGYLFYFTSFPLSYILGYLADDAANMVRKLSTR